MGSWRWRQVLQCCSTWRAAIWSANRRRFSNAVGKVQLPVQPPAQRRCIPSLRRFSTALTQRMSISTACRPPRGPFRCSWRCGLAAAFQACSARRAHARPGTASQAQPRRKTDRARRWAQASQTRPSWRVTRTSTSGKATGKAALDEGQGAQLLVVAQVGGHAGFAAASQLLGTRARWA